MKLPIKIVKSLNGLSGISSEDPDKFSSSLSLVRIGKVFKTTSFNRLEELSNFLIKQERDFQTILEVGAGDGIASLRLMKNLNYKKYFLTDKYIELYVREGNRKIELFDTEGNLQLLQKSKFMIYLDPYKAWPSPLEILTTSIFKQKEDISNLKKVYCISPKVKSLNKNIHIKEYDLLDPWNDGKADLLLSNNLLDKFTKDKPIINKFIHNLFNSLNEGGMMAVGENTKGEDTKKEQVSIFHKKSDKKLECVEIINGGSVTHNFFKVFF